METIKDQKDEIELTNASKKKETQIFGSFFLGQTEFALNIKDIQEVVALPETFTSVPLAPTYFLGFFNLRDVVIPTIDLSKILALGSASESREAQRIAIIDLQKVRVGLLFDTTGEVLRIEADEIYPFEYSKVKTSEGTSKKNKVIYGAIKLDSGKRIIQVLNPSEIVKLENVPQLANEKNVKLSHQRTYRGNRKQCISFRLGSSYCAFEIHCIQEIIKVPDAIETSLASQSCIGSFNLRGDTIPMILFSQMLGYSSEKGEPAENGDEKRIIVMKRGEEKFGLLIDSVQSIITYFTDEVLPVPAIGDDRAKMFVGCLSRSELGEVILLSYQEVLSRPEIIEITRVHGKFYHSSADKSLESKKRQKQQTYITFRLGGLLALRIDEIGEIIEFPKDLLCPPGSPAHIEGMLNLRSEIIPIMNTRKCYAMSQFESPTLRIVLIIKRPSMKFGLVVDSVENIVNISENNKLRVPESLLTLNSESLTKDIQEAIELTTGQVKNTVFILNLDSLMSRFKPAK